MPFQEWLLDDLLSAGADPNARLGGSTVLGLAARHEEAGQVRRLLDAGGDPRARDRLGKTVPANVALLLARGADVNAGGADGVSALGTALASPGRPEWRERVVDTMRPLLGAGADPNADSAWAETSVLHQAVQFDLGAAVTLLIDHGADVEYRDRGGLTAIEHAERYGRWEGYEALRAAAGLAAPDGSAASEPAADPRVPHRLDIRLGDGRGEHELSVRLEVVFPVASRAQPYRVGGALRSLEQFARAAVLGLHRFPPGRERCPLRHPHRPQ